MISRERIEDMLARIEDTFERQKKDSRKSLVGYLTAGDPDMETSEKNIRAAITAGIDILELGVPFSDPTADGPTIQAASRRSLDSGTTVAGVLRLTERLRKDFDTPIILFGYANPFMAYGLDRLFADAASAGADGFLVVDVPFEEMDELRPHAEASDLALISLVAPTTPVERAGMIAAQARGFIYYVMVTGVTGARETVNNDVAEHVRALRSRTTVPIAVGFGVANGKQAAAAAAEADAVVVGSALVKAALSGDLVELVTELRQALDTPPVA